MRTNSVKASGTASVCVEEGWAGVGSSGGVRFYSEGGRVGGAAAAVGSIWPARHSSHGGEV
jgi:hypothetical protein